MLQHLLDDHALLRTIPLVLRFEAFIFELSKDALVFVEVSAPLMQVVIREIWQRSIDSRLTDHSRSGRAIAAGIALNDILQLARPQ